MNLMDPIPGFLLYLVLGVAIGVAFFSIVRSKTKRFGLLTIAVLSVISLHVLWRLAMYVLYFLGALT